MFFLLDQKIDLAEEEKKEDKKDDQKEKDDEETQQTEDYAVNLFLQLYQDKSIDQILKNEGYEEVIYHREVKESQKLKKTKPKSKKKSKLVVTQNEEELKKEKEEMEAIEKQNKLLKRQILRDVHRKERELHNERTKLLWDEFTHLLVTMLEKAKVYGNIDFLKATNDEKEEIYYLNNIRYLWKIFIRMVEDSLAVKHAAFHNSEKNKDFLVR
jgi:hypothetical protein